MASRYLLESGAPDGYQLEDGSGVLMLEQPRCYYNTVMADSPVAYWRLGESAGTNANDEIGTLDGTYTGGHTLNQASALSGDSNPSVLLNGTTGYVSIPDNAVIDQVNGPLSWELWFKMAADTTTNMCLIGKGANAPILDIDRFTTGKLRWYVRSVALVAESLITLPSNTNWHHVVATKNAGDSQLYLDGNNVTNIVGAATATSTAVNMEIGRDPASAGPADFFSGTVDEVAIYNVVLTPAQVATHYAAQSVACFVPYTNPYPPLIAQ